VFTHSAADGPTDLTGAILVDTDLRGVDLRGVIGLIPRQVKQALIDEYTRLPHYLRSQMASQLEEYRQCFVDTQTLGNARRPTDLTVDRPLQHETSRKVFAKVVMGLVAWAAGLFGVLQLGLVTVHGAHAHGICGPWGCGPPLSALIAWHSFWLLLVAAPTGLLIRFWPADRLRLLGMVLTLAAVLSLLGVGVWEAATWLPKVPDGQPTYFVQRYLFSVVTLVDLPVIPVGLAGLAAWIAAYTRKTPHPESVIVQAVADPGLGSASTACR
jgi:hypothetical protein